MPTKRVEQRLYKWYQQPCGQALTHNIQHQLQMILPSLFGVRFLQLGFAHEHRWADTSPIVHKIFLSNKIADNPSGVAIPYELPLASESIDLAFLPHTLEIYPNSDAILQEVNRVLAPDGHVIILGINVWSLWGLWRWRKQFKPTFKIPAISQIRQHLEHNACHVRWFSTFFFRPPVKQQKWLDRLLFLESIGKIFGPYPGGAYLLAAQKITVQMRPIRLPWHWRIAESNKGVAEPTMRS